MLDDVDIVGILHVRSAGIHHRQERQAKSAASPRGRPQVREHPVIVVPAEIHVDADRVGPMCNRLFDLRDQDLAVRLRAQGRRRTQVEDQREPFVEIVLRESDDPFVQDDAGRAALRDIGHGHADVLETRDGARRNPVVHRDHEGLPAAEEAAKTNLLPGRRHPVPHASA